MGRDALGPAVSALASSSDLEVPALASTNRTTQVKFLMLSVLNFFIGKMRIMRLMDAKLEEKYVQCLKQCLEHSNNVSSGNKRGIIIIIANLLP